MKRNWVSCWFLIVILLAINSSIIVENVHGEDVLSRKLKLSGDLRLRSEYEDNKGFNNERYRWRQRFRLRLGVNADITDSVDVGLRLASGDRSYQTTGNRTFDGVNFEKFDFTLDRVYARYRQDFETVRLTLTAGKFGHIFWYPTEILWDMDLQPQGLAESLNIKGTGITVNLAQYVVRQADRDDSAGGAKRGNELYAAQLVYNASLGDAAIKTGIAYYSVADSGQLGLDAKASNSDFTTNKNFNTCTGNVDSPCTGKISDFNILNINAEFSFLKESVWPVKLVGEYVKNLGAESGPVGGNGYGDEDTAWLLGVGIGTRRPGSFRFWLSYSQIEADAVVANFNSDDLQQTNVNTISPLISYQLTKDMSVYYDGYYQERNNYPLAVDNGNAAKNDTRQYRHRINWTLKF